MKFSSISDLKQAGFQGFKRVEKLSGSLAQNVPDRPGVYAVILEKNVPPTFLRENPAGRCRGRNPTCKVAILKKRWVRKTCVLYIGKASGNSTRSTLRARVKCYLRHGSGRRAAHWGGRYIWQLFNAKTLLIAWTEASDPESLEKDLIKEFEEIYEKLPFANLRR